MNGRQAAFALPDVYFLRLPAVRRRRVASEILDTIQRLKAAAIAVRPEIKDLRERIAAAGIIADLDQIIAAWRSEIRRAVFELRQLQGAGRSPAVMGHGWPASPAGGPGCKVGKVNAAPTPDDAPALFVETRL